MTMLGIPLSTYTEELGKIPKGALPTQTIEQFAERLLPFAKQIAWRAQGYDKFDPVRHCHAFPDEFYETCSFEEHAKIFATTFFQLPRDLKKRFDDEPRYRIVRKLRSSLWRWGYGASDVEWNNIVDAYNGIRNFSFGLPDFSVTLDHTTGYNEYGYGEYDHTTYLDGVFGLRVHYRDQHVMTIGFSIARGKKLLIAQVQMKKEKGNRFLFKLPMNHVAYAVLLMKKYFPGFRHYLIDGDSSVKKYLNDFQSSLARYLERKVRYPSEESSVINDNIVYLQEHIAVLEGEGGERIRRTYALHSDTWKLSPHRPLLMNGLRFKLIVRA
jgi:hypothetical protein